jgi:hypothetical protein
MWRIFWPQLELMPAIASVWICGTWPERCSPNSICPDPSSNLGREAKQRRVLVLLNSVVFS